MSEQLHKNFVEHIVSPEKLPEIAFQSYERLSAKAENKEAFLADEVRNPHFHQSFFYDLSGLDQGLIKLASAAEAVEAFELDTERAEVTTTTLEYRMAEMEYVKLLAQLDYCMTYGADERTITDLLSRIQETNETLYGVPNPEIAHAALIEIWQQLDSKQLSGKAAQLRDELANGFDWQGEHITALLKPEYSHRPLPKFTNNEAFDWATEHILENNADLHALVNRYWEKKPEGYTCSPEDIVEVFELAIAARDPDNETGLSVQLDEDATSLSWNSADMAVHVGAKRASVKTKEELFMHVLHEFGVHGQRAINGRKSDIPVLGTGLFTNTTQPSYLVFEEGLATLAASAAMRETPKWTAANLGHYTNIFLASQGDDFRSIFEKAWRYRALMTMKEGERDLSEEKTTKAKQQAFTALTRIFRGNQPDLSTALGKNAPILTYNKDLAYLEGRYRAMEAFKELHKHRDTAGVDRLFSAKYDPTISEQAAIVEKAFS